MSKLVLFIAATLISLSALADGKELFESVPAHEAEKIREYNEPFFSAIVYPAKRYRIVEVRDQLLSTPEDRFTMNLFDDVAVAVTTKRIDTDGPPGWIVWHGYADIRERLKGSFSEQAKDPNIGMSEEGILDALTNITLRSWAWDVDASGTATRRTDRKRGMSAQGQHHPGDGCFGTSMRKMDSQAGACAQRQNQPDTGGIRRNAFRSVEGNISVLVKGEEFAVQKFFHLVPLKYTPKYHVLYERDPEKAYGFIDSPLDQLPPRQQEQARAHREFLEGLPSEDPSQPIVEEVP